MAGVVPDDDPLAGAPAVHPDDLAGRAFVIFLRVSNPRLHDHMLAWLGPRERRSAARLSVQTRK